MYYIILLGCVIFSKTVLLVRVTLLDEYIEGGGVTFPCDWYAAVRELL